VRVENVYRASPRLERLSLANDTVNLGTLQTDEPMAITVEVNVTQRPPGEHRILQLDLTGDIPSLGRQGERLRRDIRCTFTPAEPPPEQVPPSVLSMLSKVTIYRMQEQAWATLDSGDVKTATRQLERVATRLFSLGETQLARAAMLEAGRISQSGMATAKGRKEIKYGTRSLSMDLRRETYD
jgi:hypothetical protein